MKLTKGGTVVEEMKDIPNRKWWRISNLIPSVLFLIIGVIDLIMSDEFHPMFLLIGMILFLNHLSVYHLKKKSHRMLSLGAVLISVAILFYQQFVLGG